MRYVSPSLICVLIAFILVLLAAVHVPTPPWAQRVDLAWLGVAFFILSFLVR